MFLLQENEKRYICYTYLSQIQPARLDRDFDLLDEICDSRWEDGEMIAERISSQMCEIGRNETGSIKFELLRQVYLKIIRKKL